MWLFFFFSSFPHDQKSCLSAGGSCCCRSQYVFLDFSRRVIWNHLRAPIMRRLLLLRTDMLMSLRSAARLLYVPGTRYRHLVPGRFRVAAALLMLRRRITNHGIPVLIINEPSSRIRSQHDPTLSRCIVKLSLFSFFCRFSRPVLFRAKVNGTARYAPDSIEPLGAFLPVRFWPAG